jgi:hypothetical protein
MCSFQYLRTSAVEIGEWARSDGDTGHYYRTGFSVPEGSLSHTVKSLILLRLAHAPALPSVKREELTTRQAYGWQCDFMCVSPATSIVRSSEPRTPPGLLSLPASA